MWTWAHWVIHEFVANSVCHPHRGSFPWLKCFEELHPPCPPPSPLQGHCSIGTLSFTSLYLTPGTKYATVYKQRNWCFWRNQKASIFYLRIIQQTSVGRLCPPSKWVLRIHLSPELSVFTWHFPGKMIQGCHHSELKNHCIGKTAVKENCLQSLKILLAFY